MCLSPNNFGQVCAMVGRIVGMDIDETKKQKMYLNVRRMGIVP